MALLSEREFLTLRRQYRTQKTQRSSIETTWDEIDYYTGPIKESNNQAGKSGTSGAEQQERRSDVWDLTAIDGREKLAASMQGAITNPAIRWSHIIYRNAKLNEDVESRTWLDEESENAWNDIQDSDFNTEIGSAYYELAGPGHTFMAIEPLEGYVDPKTSVEGWGGVDLTCIPLKEGYFTQDRKGAIKVFWRRLMWAPTQIDDFMVSKGWECPEWIEKLIESGSEEKIEVVFCVFPREKILKRRPRYPAAPDQRPWGCIYWIENKDAGNVKLGEEGGYYEKPIHMCRFAKTAGSKWGHGPSSIALPTVKYVNAWKEMIKLALEKIVNPPWVTTQKNILGGTLDLNAGGVSVVRDIDGLKELISSGRPDLGMESIEEDRAEIRRIYRTDELQLKDSPAMTATEAQIRYELMNRVLGKTLTFIQNDLLDPIILALISMRIRMKAGNPMPKKVAVAGGAFTIEYLGPLARSQRTDEVAAIERGATFVAGLAQFYPKARAAFNPIKAIKHVFNRLGVPAEIMPTDQEMQDESDRIDQMESRMAAAAAGKDEASAAKGNAEAAAKGNGAVAGGATYPALPPEPPLSLTGAPTRRGVRLS